MSIGRRGHIGLGIEEPVDGETGGWGEGVESGVYLPFVSESLSLDIEQLISASQKGIVDESPSYSGLKSIGGDIVVEVYPNSFGYLLASALGQPTSAKAGTSAYSHAFEPSQEDWDKNCPIQPYTIEVYRDNGDAFRYLGGVVNTLNVSFGTSEKIMRATAGIIGKEYESLEKTTPSLETTNPFKWDQAVIKIATVQNNDIESFNFNLNNGLVGVPTLNNTSLISRIYRDAARTVECGMTIDFVNQTQYAIFEAQTEQAFEITLTGAKIETVTEVDHHYKMVIEIPKLRYTAYPINVSGDGRITSSVSGKAKYDTSSGYAIKITLTNTVDNATYPGAGAGE